MPEAFLTAHRCYYVGDKCKNLVNSAIQQTDSPLLPIVGAGANQRAGRRLLDGFLLDDDLHMSRDVLVELHRHIEFADGLQRLVQLNLAAIDVKALLLERVGDVAGEPALVRSANSGQTAGNYLPALGDELGEQTNILVVDALDLLDTELADLLAPEILASAFAPATAARTTAGTGTTRARAVPVAVTFRGRGRGRRLRGGAGCFGFFSHDAPSLWCGAGTAAARCR